MQDYNFNDYWWLVVPKFHDRQAAIDRFVERFGYQPEITKEDHQFFWMGPASDMLSTGGNESLDNVAD